LTERSTWDLLWEGYRDTFIGGTMVMIILLPLFIVVMVLTDSMEITFLVALGVVPVLLWYILSRGEESEKN
jgi:hypothetical protein